MGAGVDVESVVVSVEEGMGSVPSSADHFQAVAFWSIISILCGVTR
jgi:hypothetical protein